MSDAPTLQAQANPAQVQVGDLLTYTVRVDPSAGVPVQAPTLGKTFGAFEVRQSTFTGTELQAELQGFTTGQFKLGGLTFRYRDARGRELSIGVAETTVTVQEVPADPKTQGDIRGIKDVIGPVAWSPWWWVALLLIALMASGVWFYRREKKKQGPPPPPPVPTDEVALAKLRQLLASDWLDQGKVKEFYSAVSDTVREYIEVGFRCPALERTTNELFRDLRKQQAFPHHLHADLKTLLEECDLVKFAKFRPDKEEALTVHGRAQRLIDSSRIFLPEKHREDNT